MRSRPDDLGRSFSRDRALAALVGRDGKKRIEEYTRDVFTDTQRALEEDG
jgi:hypothetical protein